jgi:predicted amidohydrolase YtcJ
MLEPGSSAPSRAWSRLSGDADLLIAGGRVAGRVEPGVDTVAVRGRIIQAVGRHGDLRSLAGPRTRLVDASGGWIVPAFHDAHCHLLSFARALSRIDCAACRSIPELQKTLRSGLREREWRPMVRAMGYDHEVLVEGRHPDRYDLDAVAAGQPMRLQHRTLHVDVLNTVALRQAGLFDVESPSVERDRGSGLPTGRIFHGGDLLRGRLAHGEWEELAADVRGASQRLLAWGVTSVQDASVTNGVEEWDLFQRLADGGDLAQRVFVMPGLRHWRAVVQSRSPGSRVRLGPVKVMLEERSADVDQIRTQVSEVWAAGHAVAVHAVSEAEVTLALEVLRSRRPGLSRGPNRIEHGSVIPDGCVDDLAGSGIAVVGQPAMIASRGERYRAAYPSEMHGWLHRAASLLRAGVTYAIGSDAPAGPASPFASLFAARRRLTEGGRGLGPDDALDRAAALAALSLGPSAVVGADSWLGRLRPGAMADIAILDSWLVDPVVAPAPADTARMTVMEGRVVWERPAAAPRPGASCLQSQTDAL